MDFNPNDYHPFPGQTPADKSSVSMALASAAFGFISILSGCMGTSLIFGSIGLILALLSRGGSNTYPKHTMLGIVLNSVGVFIGVISLLTGVILVAYFGSIDNFMDAAQKYLDSYQSMMEQNLY